MVINSLICVYINTEALKIFIKSETVTPVSLALVLTNGNIMNIMFHLPISLFNNLLSDILLITCFFYRFWRADILNNNN